MKPVAMTMINPGKNVDESDIEPATHVFKSCILRTEQLWLSPFILEVSDHCCEKHEAKSLMKMYLYDCSEEVVDGKVSHLCVIVSCSKFYM